MRKNTIVSTALFACCCVSILFAGTADAVNCERKPTHPQCNGGGQGGGEHPVDLTFRDDAADKIGSDVAVSGTVTYTDGEPGVSARFRDDGILLFNIDDDDRAILLNFSDQSLPAECTAECKKNFDIASTDNFPPGAQASVQVLDNGGRQHRVDQFLGMNVGEILRGEMKIGFGNQGRTTTRFGVRFQALGEQVIDGNVEAKSSFLEITRTSQNTWFVEAVDPSTIGAGDQALLFSKFKQKGTVLLDEGTYYMPFGLTVTCQSACP